MTLGPRRRCDQLRWSKPTHRTPFICQKHWVQSSKNSSSRRKFGMTILCLIEAKTRMFGLLLGRSKLYRNVTLVCFYLSCHDQEAREEECRGFLSSFDTRTYLKMNVVNECGEYPPVLRTAECEQF